MSGILTLPSESSITVTVFSKVGHPKSLITNVPFVFIATSQTGSSPGQPVLNESPEPKFTSLLELG